jgi:hypothetical protein
MARLLYRIGPTRNAAILGGSLVEFLRSVCHYFGRVIFHCWPPKTSYHLVTQPSFSTACKDLTLTVALPSDCLTSYPTARARKMHFGIRCATNLKTSRQNQVDKGRMISSTRIFRRVKSFGSAQPCTRFKTALRADNTGCQPYNGRFRDISWSHIQQDWLPDVSGSVAALLASTDLVRRFKDMCPCVCE